MTNSRRARAVICGWDDDAGSRKGPWARSINVHTRAFVFFPSISVISHFLFSLLTLSVICRTGCDSVGRRSGLPPCSRAPLTSLPFPPRINAYLPHLTISYIMSGTLSHNRLPLPTSTSAFDLPTSPSPPSANQDDGLSPFMLHQRRRPSLLNPKLGHLSLEKRHHSPLSSSFKLRSSRRRKSTSNGEDSESDRDSNKMWISDRSASTSSESSRNATPPQQPESTLGAATATGSLFGLASKPVGDMVGARPSTPPRNPNPSFDSMDIVPRRRLSLPVRSHNYDYMLPGDSPERSFFSPTPPLLHIDCYRSSSPAC